MKKEMSDMRFTLYVLGTTLFLSLICRFVLGIEFFDKYPHIKPGQEMRCDYDGCVIVDKAQPIPVVRQSYLTGLSE